MGKITENVNVYPIKYLLKKIIESINEIWDILEENKKNNKD